MCRDPTWTSTARRPGGLVYAPPRPRLAAPRSAWPWRVPRSDRWSQPSGFSPPSASFQGVDRELPCKLMLHRSRSPAWIVFPSATIAQFALLVPPALGVGETSCPAAARSWGRAGISQSQGRASQNGFEGPARQTSRNRPGPRTRGAAGPIHKSGRPRGAHFRRRLAAPKGLRPRISGTNPVCWIRLSSRVPALDPAVSAVGGRRVWRRFSASIWASCRHRGCRGFGCASGRRKGENHRRRAGGRR